MTLRFALLLAACWLLAGCASTVRLMPTPTLLTLGDEKIAVVDPDAIEGMTIDILYATNRVPVGPTDARHYTRLRSDDLRLGVATLQVGGGPTTGGTSRATATAAAPGERPEIRLKATREMAVLDEAAEAPGPDAVAFFAHVEQLLGRGGNRSLLIYMPGANTTFERAAAQAAQFQHFMGRDAVVMVFAWPSAGTLLRYWRDVATARRSVPAFAQLLEQLSTQTHAACVDVLAYSAGAMIVSPGLALVAGGAAGTDERLRLGEIYYAAPDIDFPVFVDNLPRYKDQVRRVTGALNMGDRALSVAQWIHRVSRAGRPNLDEIGPEETRWLVAASERDELDVLSVRPGELPGLAATSHSFWYDHPWVSSDVLLKLRVHASPAARGLEPNTTDRSIAFWTFPADYEARLHALALKLAAGNGL